MGLESHRSKTHTHHGSLMSVSQTYRLIPPQSRIQLFNPPSWALTSYSLACYTQDGVRLRRAPFCNNDDIIPCIFSRSGCKEQGCGDVMLALDVHRTFLHPRNSTSSSLAGDKHTGGWSLLNQPICTHPTGTIFVYAN